MSRPIHSEQSMTVLQAHVEVNAVRSHRILAMLAASTS